MAEAGGPLAGGGLPEPEGLANGSIQNYDAAPPSFDRERAELERFYNQKMLTVEGVITGIDLAAGTITIKDGDGENVYAFDGNTRFQVRLKPIEPAELKVGSKMAGLYRPNGESLYISRVIIITGASKSRKRRR